MTSQGGFWQEDNAPLPRVVIGTSIMGGSALFMGEICKSTKVNDSKEIILVSRGNMKTT